MPNGSFAIFSITWLRIRPYTPGVSVKGWSKRTVSLDALPRQGQRVPEVNEHALRELGFYSCRILYEVKSDHLIEVLTVIHTSFHIPNRITVLATSFRSAPTWPFWNYWVD